MRGKQTFIRTVGGKTFYVVGGGGYDDVDEEMDVSEANFLVSKANFLLSELKILVCEANKLSTRARIFKGP